MATYRITYKHPVTGETAAVTVNVSPKDYAAGGPKGRYLASHIARELLAAKYAQIVTVQSVGRISR